MDYNFLTVFFTLSIINVVFATIKSIVTINGGKLTASLISGGYFAFYNIMMQYTVADFPMWQKCLITFICNVVGVYLVKWGEEKSRKDKLWKVEMAIPTGTNLTVLKNRIEWCGVPCNYIEVGKWVMFNCYCETQAQTKAMTEIAKEFNGKISAYESKTL
jgi:hypothetical protein